MWFRILSAHWILPLVIKIFTKDIWNQMQFPTALAVTQVNINLLPWECLYWGKDTTRICGSRACVQFGCWSVENIPKVPSILEWQLSPAQGWSSAGATAELRVQQNKPRVWLGLLITQSWRKDWVGRLWPGGVFSQAASDRQREMASGCSRVGSGWILGTLPSLKEWWGVGRGSPGQWWSPILGGVKEWMRCGLVDRVLSKLMFLEVFPNLMVEFYDSCCRPWYHPSLRCDLPS